VESSLLKATSLSKTQIGSLHQRLFHKAMHHILMPLIEAGTNGVLMAGGNGEVRHVFPILACYAADFPEQCLVTCTKNGTCPKCKAPSKKLGDPDEYYERTPEWTLGVINNARENAITINQFHKQCMAEDVSGSVLEPFWKDFPHTNIHAAITPDILHQLYQGVVMYLIDWCQILMTEKELDARIRALPPAFGVRHFHNGFSVLTQISGPEQKQMARILLGCIIGQVPNGVITCVKALLDFIYLAQYKAHDNETLAYLEKTLKTFEDNKKILIDLTLHPTLNIPKFHALRHYINSIKMFGTTDNYNTEMFERFHIDFAKLGYKASNKRDEFPQMINWLSRQEKVSMFSNYLDLLDNADSLKSNSKSLLSRTQITVAKHSPLPNQKLSVIQEKHRSPNFSIDLKVFLNKFLEHPTSNRHSAKFPIPFDKLDIFTQFKFHPYSLQEDNNPESIENDTVKAIPCSLNFPNGKFDTVVVMYNEEAESTGLQGSSLVSVISDAKSNRCQLGVRIGRVRIIFRLPTKLSIGAQRNISAPEIWPTEHLAYIEWYQPLSGNPNQIHGMYTVRKTAGGQPQCSIVSLRSIRQSCMLIPQFSDNWKSLQWTTDNILDNADNFILNNFQSPYSYQTLW